MKLLDSKEFTGPQLQVMVWCRNGSMCNNATPCDDIICGFKPMPQDVLQGIKQCDNYQVTLPSFTWDDARQLDLVIRKEKD